MTPSIVKLKLFVDLAAPDWSALREHYKTAIAAHNQKILDTAPFADAGFDLWVPTTTYIEDGETVFLDHHVKCAMTWNHTPTGFYLYPRSSLSKTPLTLANSVGIIDAGYRGNLIGAFRKGPILPCYKIEPKTRLLQICHPQLLPMQVELVDSVSQLGEVTARGSGGFGSTGGNP